MPSSSAAHRALRRLRDGLAAALRRPPRGPPPRRGPDGRPLRAVIGNRKDGGVVFWLARLYGFTFAIALAAFVVVGLSIYGYFAHQVRETPALERYVQDAPAVSRIVAADGSLLGEFATEWRELAAFDEIPRPLIDAFLAAEDHEFFEHRGIYFKGIARAAWRNLTAGDYAQGGSTITQQVAKQFLSSEKSLTRKAKEAILARRLEARYSKEAIFAVYLNQIFLGNGAYGVRAAAQRYFGKKLDELDLGEMALIAGLAQAPSAYSPVHHPEAAKARRDQILDKMARHGFIAAADAAAWQAAPIELAVRDDRFGDRSPYYAEHVRRYLLKRYGKDALLSGGLEVETAVEPVIDAQAYASADFGAHKQDKRQGWRGPEAYLDAGKPRELFRRRSLALYGEGPLEPGRRYLALVEKVTATEADVRIGGMTRRLPLENARWAARWSKADATNDRTIDSLIGVVRVGDVIWVSQAVPIDRPYFDWRLDEGNNPRWIEPVKSEEAAGRSAARMGDQVRLEQVPHPEIAIFSADHETGYVVGMVGGTDFFRSQYNRATQALRQPGSTYKPIYYSAALDAGYGFDTALNDVPRAEVDPVTGEVWTPQNLGGTVDVVVNLEYSMVFSKNVPSVAIFKKVGADAVAAWARRLGFTTEIIADRALALGASSTLLSELTRAFAIFARNGRGLTRRGTGTAAAAGDWTYVRRVLDREGKVLEDNTVYFDPGLDAATRLDRLAATAGVRPPQAIPARAGYLTSKLLATTIEYGFSSIIRRAGLIVAGKTGTSSATMDTTFVAYTSRFVTTVWMGDDLRERPLGTKDAAYMVVEPVWARFMIEASEGYPKKKIPWQVPSGVSPGDRGDAKGPQHTMPLVYRKAAKPGDLPAGLTPLPDE